HEQIARAAIAIDDPILQEGFDLKPEAFESGARASLIGRHHRGHLFDSALLADVEDLFGEPPAESGAAMRWSEQHADFADAARPTRLIVVQTRVADDLIVDFRQQTYGSAFFDVAEPFVERGLFGDIGAQEEEVVGRE